MVLFDDVVEILGLADVDSCLLLSVVALARRSVDTTLINRDLLGEAVTTDRLVQKALSCCTITMGGEEEVNSLAGLVHRLIQLLPSQNGCL